MILYVALQSCQIGTNLWLEHWTSVKDDEGHKPALFLGVYAAITIAFMFMNYAVTYVIMVWAGVRATARLHDDLLDSILRLPMSFFDTTPLVFFFISPLTTLPHFIFADNLSTSTIETSK